ncbi:hypothetical protein BYT27DRAFT_7191038 [Phlegmacium glaucopus]|nr:hypothetical protein BYT27DRAFT_7191038 [Phlegmacium glaucopus]
MSVSQNTHCKFRFGHAVAMGHGHKQPFLTHIHYSLKNLGRWEGSTAAFVLSETFSRGIGVLLRMIWVLATVMYRTARGQPSDEHEYSQIDKGSATYTSPVNWPVSLGAADQKTCIRLTW